MGKYIWVLVLVCSSAYADRINVNLASHHFFPPPEGVEKWNEKNYGMGYEKTLEYNYITSGFFKNSFDEDSFYIGVGKEWSHSKYIHTGMEALLSTGYQEHKEFVDGPFIGDVTIFADLYFSVGNKNRIKTIWGGAFFAIQYQLKF